MWKSSTVCCLLVALAVGCVHRRMTETSHVAPPSAAPRPSVQVSEIAGGAAPPANVTKVFRVSQLGKPVTMLQPSAFRIQEDGQPVDSKAVDLRLLPRDEVIAFHTVLLLDLGPSATKEGKAALSQAATRFVQELRKRQAISVFAFDGANYVRFVGEFPRNAGGDKAVVAERNLPAPSDPARNLRGAVVEGLKRLESKLKQYPQPIRVGSLVVFTMGPDQANHTPEATLTTQLEQAQNDVYYVSVQAPGNENVPRELSRSGQAISPDLAHLSDAFTNITGLVSAKMDGHYVISYCSLARSGSRKLRVEVDVVSDELDVETGVIESQYDASGFSTGCKTAKLPRLALSKATAKN
jgi:hypothetical protein